MSIDIEKERPGFEAWFSDGGKFPKAVERSGEGYMLLQAQQAWIAWQAARATPPAPTPAAAEGQADPVGTFLRVKDAFGEVYLHMRGEHEYADAIDLYAAPLPRQAAVQDDFADCKWAGGKCGCTRAQAQRCEILNSAPPRSTPPAAPQTAPDQAKSAPATTEKGKS